jgi:hypothetical protein
MRNNILNFGVDGGIKLQMERVEYNQGIGKTD